MKADPPCALVIGGSRGIGAAIVGALAARGWSVVLTYHTHLKRAERLVASLPPEWPRPTLLQVDICDAASVAAMTAAATAQLPRIDCLVLSASGGLEIGKPPSYAHAINVDAQVRLVRTLLPWIPPAGRIVFLTSHEAHFSDRKPPYPPYALIARTKKDGEEGLRALAGELARCSVVLEIVSADLVEGTATAKLLEMDAPDRIAARRAEVGRLPTPEDVAAHVAELAEAPRAPGVFTTYVWEADARYTGHQQEG